jgi:hypothetical protein
MTTRGLNSPSEKYFFTKRPDEYKIPIGDYSYTIEQATEQTMARAKSETFRTHEFEIVTFDKPKVDVKERKYIYVVRSFAKRDNFAMVMSPRSAYESGGNGIIGLHYAAGEPYGDAIGITIDANSPQAAKEQFHSWYAKIQEALKALEQRFAVLNEEVKTKIEELASHRLEELNRAKDAL